MGGMSEVSRKGENQTELRSGHLFHYRAEENTLEGVIGFPINKAHDNEIERVPTRVIYPILEKRNENYSSVFCSNINPQ